ncbi:low molecular weight phosphotyrosine phosphatase family protein [Burkholderia ambifaria AMMD]|uniref:protein-tyrosine-phosphatase n=1 Tax=Burkholderia ambifaria (strain ATCC BAA-244 / DSM 16087 / CCUG 44356 / LMG 19182 / AMMD) TaxID=339670 RepID=Q0BDQ2_BURCM|nr:low molecular weight protein-tyrosine-phosphatase [Burkholderia ambifaria]ABI87721.1 protein tyrosine phosphatase [Burkholderia ambifaria AMMD]AJY20857.1 low molecular weight phosphotyrosine phosphatase family protein [Burkholderia ambifaria AMMD]MBR7929211.1 low molecular weight phosphotyrosine protein phosphatase [Burkholderia ambifaria]MBR8344902.1 low molecular weight phosphotyrosine protein phosphatase [Burkholderia ambifaria]NHL66789.1 low molecular weight phosphotyrosine protein phos
MTRVAICFVCLGNICRSPTAEGVMRHQVDAAGLAEHIAIDSAGTGDWHVGEPPDTRAQAAARIRGYDLSALRARQVSAADFERFDLLLAMDEANLAELRRRCPPEHRDKVRLLMEFAAGAAETEVADPYFGGAQGFDQVLDQVERACAGLLDTLRSRTGR